MTTFKTIDRTSTVDEWNTAQYYLNQGPGTRHNGDLVLTPYQQRQLLNNKCVRCHGHYLISQGPPPQIKEYSSLSTWLGILGVVTLSVAAGFVVGRRTKKAK